MIKQNIPARVCRRKVRVNMDYRTEYQKWLSSAVLSQAEHLELEAIADDEKEQESRFFAPLSFGTAGLRGVLGMGLNRMNIYTVRQATQGIAELVVSCGEEAMARGVAVCHDCRIMSPEFAREVASVLAGNGIAVHIFDAMRPTPELSFAIRALHCIAGINITASHNPKEYNGYKVYWEDGAQLPPKEADIAAQAIAATDIFTGAKRMDFDEGLARGLIRWMGEEMDEAFLREARAMAINPACVEAVADSFKLVYTPFHGTGYQLVPEILRRLGYRHILCVPEQMVPDGAFPTVKSPNPEDKAGFALAIELARKNDVDLIIGTDPDADRVGIVLKNSAGEYVTLSGNQVGVLLADYIIGAHRRAGTLPKNAAIIKTIVTTEMARRVAEQNGVKCFETFTGFKFMAEKIKQFEEEGSYRYLLAYEESYGYLMGDYARDKDAVTASMLIAEMAAYYRTQGMTLYDAMQKLYETYGYYSERTISLVMPGVDGLKDMARLMKTLREAPPQDIAGTPVSRVRDYADGTVRSQDGTVEKMELSGSNVLYFELQDGSVFIVRPSGTEPKIKIYLMASGKDAAQAAAKIERYTAAADALRSLAK